MAVAFPPLIFVGLGEVRLLERCSSSEASSLAARGFVLRIS